MGSLVRERWKPRGKAGWRAWEAGSEGTRLKAIMSAPPCKNKSPPRATLCMMARLSAFHLGHRQPSPQRLGHAPRRLLVVLPLHADPTTPTTHSGMSGQGNQRFGSPWARAPNAEGYRKAGECLSRCQFAQKAGNQKGTNFTTLFLHFGAIWCV